MHWIHLLVRESWKAFCDQNVGLTPQFRYLVSLAYLYSQLSRTFPGLASPLVRAFFSVRSWQNVLSRVESESDVCLMHVGTLLENTQQIRLASSSAAAKATSDQNAEAFKESSADQGRKRFFEPKIRYPQPNNNPQLPWTPTHQTKKWRFLPTRMGGLLQVKERLLNLWFLTDCSKYIGNGGAVKTPSVCQSTEDYLSVETSVWKYLSPFVWNSSS